MITQKNIEESHSVLRLDHILFDEISFVRSGFQTNNSPKFTLELTIGNTPQDDAHLVSLNLTCTVEEEYTANIQLSGFFHITGNIPDTQKDILLRQNAVAILFPYLRSELSLLTAQPEVAPVVIPPLNIAKMISESDSAKQRAENK